MSIYHDWCNKFHIKNCVLIRERYIVLEKFLNNQNLTAMTSWFFWNAQYVAIRPKGANNYPRD